MIVGFGQKIEGIGISCPGPLDLINGIILETPNLPGWNYFHLTEALQQITGIKVQLQNDANLAGLAEAVIGAGAGLCIDGKIYQGAKGFAQEDRI